jgi:hypothetical protein
MPSMRDNLTLVVADIRDALADIPDGSLAGAILDPPYGLGLTGAAWDRSAIAFNVEFWELVRSKIAPGGTLACFGHSRTFARQTISVEDAGFQVIDHLAWAKGHGHATGSRHVSSELAKLGAPGQLVDEYEGWETQLRPAFEPILIARNLGPKETLIQAFAAGGRGGFNVGASLIEADAAEDRSRRNGGITDRTNRAISRPPGSRSAAIVGGRKTSNLLLEHSEACTDLVCVPRCPVALIDTQARKKYAPGKEVPSRFLSKIRY